MDMMNTLQYRREGNVLTVFYADDDQDDLDVFKDVAEDIDENLDVHTHNNGDMLLNALDNPPPTPQIVFLDLNMPGKNGMDVLQEIRQIRKLDELPVVILSTSDDDKTINDCRAMGANYFITKATDYIKLKESIDHALRIDWGTFRPEPKDFFYKNYLS